MQCDNITNNEKLHGSDIVKLGCYSSSQLNFCLMTGFSLGDVHKLKNKKRGWRGLSKG
jgi:hypothetical protein